MNRGYVKLWRKSLNAGWLKRHNLWIFCSYCLLKANHKKNFKAIIHNQEINLQPGQFIFGRKVTAEETGLTEREIRTCLALLIKWQNVTIKTTNRYSIISIINWPIYQSEEIENDQLNDQRPTSNRPHTRTKEHKNNKYAQDALEVLSYLNRKTEKRYRITKHIEARLKEGRTVEDCKRVIDNKIKDPYFIDNPKYLNPETLFRPSNFDKYVNESSAIISPEKPPLKISICPRCKAQTPPQDRIGEGCIHCERKEQAYA